MMLRAFRVVSPRTISSSSFSSTSKREELATCPNRAKIFTHYQSTLNQLADEFIANAPAFSINTSTSILKNLNSLNLTHPKLREAVKKSIEDKLSTDLSPQNAVPLLLSVCESIEGDESRIMKQVYDYLKKYYYLFSYEELKKAEYIYMQSGKFIQLKFDSQLTEEVTYKEEPTTQLDSHYTYDALNYYKISIPKKVGATFNDHKSIFRLQLAEQQQMVTFIAIDRNDYHSIKQMKEHLINDRTTRHFVIDEPPFTQTQFAQIGSPAELKQKELKAMMFGSAKARSYDPESLLRSLGEIPVLTADLLKFYVEEYLLKDRDANRLGVQERIIYSKRYGMAEPNESATFCYDTFQRDKKKECKILLAALPLQDEIAQQVAASSTSQLHSQFLQMRALNISSKIEWACRASHIGCVKCGANLRGPRDLLDIADQSVYDYSFRERHFARQTLAFMQSNAESDRFTVFVDKNRQWQVIKHFVEALTTELTNNAPWDQTKDLRQIQLQQKRTHQPNSIQADKKEYIEKYARISSYFSATRDVDHPFKDSKEDRRSFEENLKAISSQLHPDSCFGQLNQRLRKSKVSDSCFAQDLLVL